MPVLGAGRYMDYVAFGCVQRFAPALLYSPMPLEEVEHLLAGVDVPERSRTFGEGHAIGAEPAGLVGGYGLEMGLIHRLQGHWRSWL